MDAESIKNARDAAIAHLQAEIERLQAQLANEKNTNQHQIAANRDLKKEVEQLRTKVDIDETVIETLRAITAAKG
jgi:hypothetical protein